MRYDARTVRGRGEGRRIGFPTINLEIPPGFAAEHGVYAGRVWLEGRDGPGLPAAFHYGPVPTFGVAAASLEAHVIDRDIPQAPETVGFELVARLREVRNFEGAEALARQIAADVADARAVLGMTPARPPRTGPEGV